MSVSSQTPGQNEKTLLDAKYYSSLSALFTMAPYLYTDVLQSGKPIMCGGVMSMLQLHFLTPSSILYTSVLYYLPSKFAS